jgi:hypothetical protein
MSRVQTAFTVHKPQWVMGTTTSSRKVTSSDLQVAETLLLAQRADKEILAALQYRGLDETAASEVLRAVRNEEVIHVSDPVIPPSVANRFIPESYPYPKKLCFWIFLCLVPLLTVIFAWRRHAEVDQYLGYGIGSILASAAFSFCVFPLLKVPFYDVPMAYLRAVRTGTLKGVPRSAGVVGMIQGSLLFALGIALTYLSAHISQRWQLPFSIVLVGLIISGPALFARGLAVALFRSPAMATFLLATCAGILAFLYWVVRAWG